MMHEVDFYILLVVFVIAVTDVALILLNKPSYSRRMGVIDEHWGFSFYLWGVLGGHYASAGNQPVYGNIWISIAILAASCLLVAATHRIMLKQANLPKWFVLTYLAVGVPAGYFLWPIM